MQRREIEEGVVFKEIVKNGRNFFGAAFRIAFEVDGENGLVQAHADEYPAVAVLLVEIQPDSLVVFRGRRNEGQGPGIAGQLFDDPVAQGLEIAAFFKVQARFFRFRRLGQIPDEIGELAPVFALSGQRDQKPRDEISAVVEEVVLFERGVPAGLDGERGIFSRGVAPDGFVDDVFVASAETAVLSAVRLNELRQPVARHRIGHDRARLFGKQDGRDEGDQPVAVDLFAVFVHGARPVHVGVENDPEIGPGIFHRFAHRAHRRFVFGVGDVIGKAPVRFEKLRAGRVRAEREKHFFRIESARAVSGVHENALAFQRPFFARRRPDFLYESRGIDVEIGSGFPAARGDCGEIALRRGGENFSDVLGAQSAVGRKELEAVAVEGQMAGGDHHRAVAGERFVF